MVLLLVSVVQFKKNKIRQHLLEICCHMFWDRRDDLTASFRAGGGGALFFLVLTVALLWPWLKSLMLFVYCRLRSMSASRYSRHCWFCE